MANKTQETMEALSTASSNSGGSGEGAGELKCEKCGKVCRSKAGLSLHVRKIHPEEYHATNIPDQKVKARWDEDECYQLARAEAELVASSVQARKVNASLYEKFPDRTQEAVKGQRRKAAYKELVGKLVKEIKGQERSQVHLAPSCEQMGDEAVTSTSETTRETGVDQVNVEAGLPIEPVNHEDSIPRMSDQRADPGIPDLRSTWSELLLQDLMRLVESFDNEPSEHIRPIMDLLRVGGEDSMNELKSRMDLWLCDLFPQSPKRNSDNQAGDSDLRPRGEKKREFDPRKRNNRQVRIKQRRLNPKRVARQCAYRRI